MKFDKDDLCLPYDVLDGELCDCFDYTSGYWGTEIAEFAAQACNNYHALVESLKDMIEVCYDETLPCSDKAKALIKELEK